MSDPTDLKFIGPWWATPLGGAGGGVVGFWVGGLAGMLR